LIFVPLLLSVVLLGTARLGFSDVGDIVLQLIQKIFVKLAGERLLVPTGLPSIVVKVDSVLGSLSRVL